MCSQFSQLYLFHSLSPHRKTFVIQSCKKESFFLILPILTGKHIQLNRFSIQFKNQLIVLIRPFSVLFTLYALVFIQNYDVGKVNFFRF